MAFNFENQEERRPNEGGGLGELASRPLFMGRPDSPYERALSRSWMAKGVFTLNGKPRENIRSTWIRWIRCCGITLPGSEKCTADSSQLSVGWRLL